MFAAGADRNVVTKTMPARVLIVAGLDRSLLIFRGPLLRAMVAAGHEVIAAAPMEDPEVARQLAEWGIRFFPLPLERAGLNPLRDWQTRRSLEALFRREQPSVVLLYTIKPVIHGLAAAKKSGVPNAYALITGLGAAFHTPGLKGRLLAFLASLLYRRAFRHCRRVIVQNPDIAAFFLKSGIVRSQAQLAIVLGSGVDTKVFAARAIPAGAPVFLLLGRMLRDKGIMEYVAAARRVRETLPSARFLLVGDTDSNPASLSVHWLAALNREGVVEYRPGVKDVRPLLAECTCYVLPSYHEGLPRTILEAMSTGRPIITTDVLGCRETILDAGPADSERVRAGRNGLLVPHRQEVPLAIAMLRMARDPLLAAEMARESRAIAEKRFDVGRINGQMFALMDLLPDQHSLETGAC